MSGIPLPLEVRLPKRPADGWVSVRCPLHDDRSPSASILFRGGVPVLLHCFSPACPANTASLLIRKYEMGGGVLIIREASWKGARPSPRAKPPSTPRARGGELSVQDDAAIETLKMLLRIEALEIRNGRFREDGAQFWGAFMEAKHVPPQWREFPDRPLCGVGLHYPVFELRISAYGVRVEKTGRFHVRLNASKPKALFLPDEPEEEAPEWERRIRIYTPDLGAFRRVLSGESDRPLVLTEAPHQALRVQGLSGAVACSPFGIGQMAPLCQTLVALNFPVAVVFADDPVSLPPGVRGVIQDLDLIDNRALGLILMRFLER